MPRTLLRWLRVLGPLIALDAAASAAGSATADDAAAGAGAGAGSLSNIERRCEQAVPHSIFQQLLKIT